MPFLDVMDARSGFVDASAVKDLGLDLTARYNAGAPFPHIVIDDFLPPAILDAVLEDFGRVEGENDGMSFFRAQEKLKSSFTPDVLTPRLRALFYSFNSRPFIRMLENITGIKGLIPDPFFLGAGLHEIKQGGHLSVHADFNHHKPMNLERRINVLIYLNKDWQVDYGGSLELWNEAMTEKVQDVVPLFNRCVIFNTTSNSQHGNPQPIAHPAGVSRKSIALYYYTSTWDGTKRAHNTQFQVRPGTADRRDWAVRIDGWKHDVLPPIALREWNRLKDRLRRARRHPERET